MREASRVRVTGLRRCSCPKGRTGGLDAIQPLATLPVFFKLSGRKVALAGGGEAAGWKAELLASAGARVDVYAAEPSAKLLEIAARRESIAIIRRRWSAEDLSGAALAILEAQSETEAIAFREAARAAGAAVNVIDRPEYCDFSFGTLVNRSPLVVAISTDGAAPVFAQAIRARLEALLPQSFAKWAEAARELRRRDRRTRARFPPAPDLLGEFCRARAARGARRAPRPAISTRWRPRATRARRRRGARSCWSARGRAIRTSSP